MLSFLIKIALASSIAFLVPGALPAASLTPATAGKQILGTDLFDLPVITSVRGRVVKVRVPAGYESVTLERRAVKHRPPVPLATQAAGGTARELIFRLRAPVPRRLLQLSSIREPNVLEDGRLTEFFAEPLENMKAPTAITLDYGSIATLSGSVGNAAAALPGGSLTLASNGLSTSATSDTSASREVLEGDIWKKKGDRIYFFNQYRGLQVIDVQNPADPALAGEVYLPATGVNLYPLGEHHVVLLTANSSNFQWNQEPIQVAQGEVLICDVRENQPKIVGRLPYQGSLVQSRLVGGSLYLATQKYEPAISNYAIKVTGFDLRNPAQPITRNTVQLPPTVNYNYYPEDTVQANDRYFLVARDSYAANALTLFQQSEVTLVDISAPDATVVKRGTATVDGIVDDKFKIQEHDGVLTIISWHLSRKNGFTRMLTQLANFDVSNPDAPQPLGSLDLGVGESLRGTRFDGDRVYLVTFRQIDPLWIVDNSNPAAPAITGHLEVPGFSSYLEPLGDRLVTMGMVNSQPTVSLFDVSNPAAPKTLSQVTLTSNYSTSEAFITEKAFTVLPEEGLVMVPIAENYYYNFNFANSTLQLLDLERDALKLRGKITDARGVRRSTVHRGKVLALGSASLLTADISDRDKPVVLADLDLASRVDRVWRQGDYLLQIGGSVSSHDQVLSVSRADAPEQILSTFALRNEYILSAHLHDGHLYVLQYITDVTTDPPGENAGITHMELQVLNVGSLPQVVRASTLSLSPDFPVNLAAAKFLFPKPGTMVLTTQTQYYGGCVTPYPIYHVQPIDISVPIDFNGEGAFRPVTVVFQSGSSPTLANASTGSSSIWAGPTAIYFGPPARDFATFDISQPKAVKLLGTKRVQPPQGSSLSEAFAANGKVFFTHYNGWPPFLIIRTGDAAKSEPAGNVYGINLANRHFLDVVDFTDAANPVVRPPASAPGALQGINANGSVFYSVGPGYQLNGKPISGSWGLHASAYTGRKMALIDTFSVKDRAATATPAGDRVFVVSFRSEYPGGPKLTAQFLDFNHEKLTLLDEAPFPSRFARTLDHYLLGLNYNNSNGLSELVALDFANPRDLQFRGYHAMSRYTSDLQNLVADAQDGFFFAAGIYGLMHIPQPE